MMVTDRSALVIVAVVWALMALPGYIWMGFALGALLRKMGGPPLHAWIPVVRWVAAARAARMTVTPVAIARSVAVVGWTAYALGAVLVILQAPEIPAAGRVLLTAGGLMGLLGSLVGWALWIYGSGTIEMRLRAPAALSWLAALSPVIWASVLGWGKYGRREEGGVRPADAAARGAHASMSSDIPVGNAELAESSGVTPAAHAGQQELPAPQADAHAFGQEPAGEQAESAASAPHAPSPGVSPMEAPMTPEGFPPPSHYPPPPAGYPGSPEATPTADSASPDSEAEPLAAADQGEAAVEKAVQEETPSNREEQPAPLAPLPWGAVHAQAPAAPTEDDRPASPAAPDVESAPEPEPEPAPEPEPEPAPEPEPMTASPATPVTDPAPIAAPAQVAASAPAPSPAVEDAPVTAPLSLLPPGWPVPGGEPNAEDSVDEHTVVAPLVGQPQPPAPAASPASSPPVEWEAPALPPESDSEPQAPAAQTPQRQQDEPSSQSEASSPAPSYGEPAPYTGPLSPYLRGPSTPPGDSPRRSGASIAPADLVFPPEDDAPSPAPSAVAPAQPAQPVQATEPATVPEPAQQAKQPTAPEPEPAPAQAEPASAGGDDDSTVIAQRRQERWLLEVVGGASYPLPDGPVVIGRATASQTAGRLGIQDSTRTMSKVHAELTPQDGAWIVRDLGSTNGTYVRQGGDERRVEGDAGMRIDGILLLGDLEARIVRDGGGQ